MSPSFQQSRKRLLLTVLIAGSLWSWTRAEDIFPQSDLNPAPTFEPVKLPSPIDVSGKEYSTDVDKNAAGVSDPGQVVGWKGDGKTVWDSIDYYVQSDGGSGDGQSFQTDAISNIRNKYFFDLDGTRTAVQCPEDGLYYTDTVSLVVSLRKKTGCTDNGYQNNIYASRSSFRGGKSELWADWKTNINENFTENDDLDGLELNGQQTHNANVYSRQGDLNTDGNGRISAYRYRPDRVDTTTGALGASVPYLRTDTLLDAVIDNGGHHPDWKTVDPNSFDVDAMMIWDVAEDNDSADADTFGPGDKILFSVRPIDGLFDGGEIWLYTYGDEYATFLVHGYMADGVTRRIWNTDNDVSQYFFGDDLHGEDIDALEAVAPEPSTMILLAIPAALLAWRRFRR
jgi:hypothetical protein